ncbi:hypothetical protein [Bradyrhizobium roseum]|uniref:hypothetical protein n=1 Tax=Bradyrhizobium roseum TaxID=3056648 RepID=UPI0026078C42|nr:hypothetical protein [Bradyrhizobium roseus]WKA25892.1 hypothetical protein QUH67_19935 [Bradyrhizobium roseus]
MQDFIHDENIIRYRKLIAIAESDPTRDEARYQMLLRLLADEVAKDAQPMPMIGNTLSDIKSRAEKPG